jgi:hypothetical protein
VEGDDHREAYTTIMQGGLLSRERCKIAEAEAVDTAEGNMCGPAIARDCRSAVVEDPIMYKGNPSEPGRSHVWPEGILRRSGPRREGDEPKPMMNGREKSDPAVVAVKSANGAGPPAEEGMERRAGTKGNVGRQSTLRAQDRAGVSQALNRVRQAARQREGERFTSLLHHIDVRLLRESYLALRRDAAPGVDGVTWKDYGGDLESLGSSICTTGSMAGRIGRNRQGG